MKAGFNLSSTPELTTIERLRGRNLTRGPEAMAGISRLATSEKVGGKSQGRTGGETRKPYASPAPFSIPVHATARRYRSKNPKVTLLLRCPTSRVRRSLAKRVEKLDVEEYFFGLMFLCSGSVVTKKQMNDM
jgi:hypothetical protein